MKYLSKILLSTLLVGMLFSACTKVDDLPNYGMNSTGKASTMIASTATIAALSADSAKVGLVLNWTSPKYATDSATTKYFIEIDSTGRNFAKAVTRTIMGALSTSFTNKELNTILLGFGFQFGVAYDIDIRLTTSYGNNNEKIVANTLKIKMTPYKIPPRIALPASGKLFLVGDASQGGWNNPVPVPTQEFARLDETTWGGVFNLIGGKQFLILPVNGEWTNKFSVANGALPGLSAGGDFGYNLNDNFPSPATNGMYRIIVDFQTGKFTVTPFTSTLPANLFIVGDATPGGWNNPVPVATQRFTRLNSSEFTLTLNGMISGKEYLLLPVNGDWNNKYAVANSALPGLSGGGDFGYNFAQNFPSPSVSGNYKIDVNFVTLKFKTTKL